MLKRIWPTFVFIGLVFSGISTTFGGHQIPPAPKSYVYEETAVITPETKAALERLLFEHSRITSEQIVYAVFSSLEDESLEEFTTKVFEQWKPGAARKNNGVLVAFYWKEHKVRIEVGYGLEAQLTDAKSKDIISEIIVPELRAGKPDAAFIQSAIEILKVIDSPLITDGRATDLLKGARIPHRLVQRTSLPLGTVIFLWIIVFAVIAFFARLIYESIAQESFYSSQGWGKTSRIRRGSIFGGGGGFGSGGGFGGFGGSGGGGGFGGGG